MRRGPTDLSSSPLEGAGRGEGKPCPLSPLCPYTRGIMPVLPVQMRSEILPFVQNDSGEDQNDSSLKRGTPFYPSPLEGEGQGGG